MYRHTDNWLSKIETYLLAAIAMSGDITPWVVEVWQPLHPLIPDLFYCRQFVSGASRRSALAFVEPQQCGVGVKDIEWHGGVEGGPSALRVP